MNEHEDECKIGANVENILIYHRDCYKIFRIDSIQFSIIISLFTL